MREVVDTAMPTNLFRRKLDKIIKMAENVEVHL
jgi:hypothetical protein